jgi:hypothetical protein
VYLTFLEAVTLILKHATFLRLSNLSCESALTHADLDYQQANIHSKIQQHLTASSQEHSIVLFAAFIMATDIGSFILTSVKRISHQLCTESMHPDVPVPSQSSFETPVHQKKGHWFKQFWEPVFPRRISLLKLRKKK